MTVRDATPDDRPALVRLQSLLPRSNPELLQTALRGAGTVLVSTDADDRPVGYLCAIAGPSGAHVAELAVASAHRREGRATRLLETLLDGVDGPVTLAVAPENEAARRCYEAVGFEVTAREETYFEGYPALLLRHSN